MKCIECCVQIMPGDWVVEEVVKGITLPLVHRECLEPMEYRNIIHRGGSVFQCQPPEQEGDNHENVEHSS